VQWCGQVDFIFYFDFVVLHVGVGAAEEVRIAPVLQQFLKDCRILVEDGVVNGGASVAVNPVGIRLLLQEDVHSLQVVEFHRLEEGGLLQAVALVQLDLLAQHCVQDLCLSTLHCLVEDALVGRVTSAGVAVAQQ